MIAGSGARPGPPIPNGARMLSAPSDAAMAALRDYRAALAAVAASPSPSAALLERADAAAARWTLERRALVFCRTWGAR